MAKCLSGALALTSATLALAPVAHATAPPPILKSSYLSAKRIARGSQPAYYSMGAVVRFNRGLTSSERRRYGLIATQWIFRDHLDVGRSLPDELFAGTSLGRIGAKRRHCYLAEVAQLHAWHAVRPGSSWRLALHDGHTVLRNAMRTVLHTMQTTRTVREQASQLGCY